MITILIVMNIVVFTFAAILLVHSYVITFKEEKENTAGQALSWTVTIAVFILSIVMYVLCVQKHMEIAIIDYEAGKYTIETTQETIKTVIKNE